MGSLVSTLRQGFAAADMDPHDATFFQQTPITVSGCPTAKAAKKAATARAHKSSRPGRRR